MLDNKSKSSGLVSKDAFSVGEPSRYKRAFKHRRHLVRTPLLYHGLRRMPCIIRHFRCAVTLTLCGPMCVRHARVLLWRREIRSMIVISGAEPHHRPLPFPFHRPLKALQTLRCVHIHPLHLTHLSPNLWFNSNRILDGNTPVYNGRHFGGNGNTQVGKAEIHNRSLFNRVRFIQAPCTWSGDYAGPDRWTTASPCIQ